MAPATNTAGPLDGGGVKPAGTPAAKAVGGPEPAGPALAVLRRMWVQLLQKSWTSLVIAPIEDGDTARKIAAPAADIGQYFGLAKIDFIDARGLSPAEAALLKKHIDALTASGARVIVAIDPPLDSAAGMSLLVSAGAVLVLARVGATRIDAVARVVEIVRRERVLGCITYREA